jgi:ribonuclease P protein component
LAKSERIQASHIFRQLYAEGRRQQSRFVVLYARANPTGNRQLGVVTSRRVGNAVQRNRARRLLRETYRHHKHQLPAHLQLVMIARPAIVGQSLAAVTTDVLRAWETAGLLRKD